MHSSATRVLYAFDQTPSLRVRERGLARETSSYDSSFECDRPQTLVEGGLGVASYPGPSKSGGERAWYTLHAHACTGGPQLQKNVG